MILELIRKKPYNQKNIAGTLAESINSLQLEPINEIVTLSSSELEEEIVHTEELVRNDNEKTDYKQDENDCNSLNKENRKNNYNTNKTDCKPIKSTEYNKDFIQDVEDFSEERCLNREINQTDITYIIDSITRDDKNNNAVIPIINNEKIDLSIPREIFVDKVEDKPETSNANFDLTDVVNLHLSEVTNLLELQLKQKELLPVEYKVPETQSEQKQSEESKSNNKIFLKEIVKKPTTTTGIERISSENLGQTQHLQLINAVPQARDDLDEIKEKQLFIDSLPQLRPNNSYHQYNGTKESVQHLVSDAQEKEVDSSPRKNSPYTEQYHKSLKKYLRTSNRNSDCEVPGGSDKPPPPIPLQTYRWEDLRRAKERVSSPNNLQINILFKYSIIYCIIVICIILHSVE